jgi:phosphoribosylformimino-5-aminoimidazole carboxamide ribotide isomerase
LTEAVSIPVVASGGVSDLKDIEALCEVSNIGIRGVITGRAIYEGTLNFEAAQQLADKLTQPL